MSEMLLPTLLSKSAKSAKPPLAEPVLGEFPNAESVLANDGPWKLNTITNIRLVEDRVKMSLIYL